VLSSGLIVGPSFDGGGSSSSPGVTSRVLDVALDPKDTGGSYEVDVWSTDGAVPDDTLLVRVAEELLPTLPGWDSAAGSAAGAA
jgi:hypothetical protein